MNIQPPVNLYPNRYAVNLGEGGCNPIVPAFVGALAMFVLPPLLTGIASGMRDEYREHRLTEDRGRTRRQRNRGR